MHGLPLVRHRRHERGAPLQTVRQPFSQTPRAHALLQEGAPQHPRREGAGQEPGAKASASGQAAAQAKAKAKAKARAPSQDRARWPWTKPSATYEQSEAGTLLRLDPRRVDDDVYKQEILGSVARHFRDQPALQDSVARRRQAMREKADRLPPQQRVEHLQKRHKEAMTELRQLIEAQAATEAQLHQLQARSREQYEAVEDQRDVVEELREALERAEMDVPPKGKPKAVGRQLHPSDPEALLGRMSFTNVLTVAKKKFFAEAGGTVSDVLSRRASQGFDMLHSARHEIAADRKAVEAQVAEDRRKAFQLHKELNPSGVQPSDKRTRDGCTDVEGDEFMEEVAGGLGAEDDEAGEPWQKVVSRRTGKGGIRALSGPRISLIIISPSAAITARRGPASDRTPFACGSGRQERPRSVSAEKHGDRHARGRYGVRYSAVIGEQDDSEASAC